MTSSNTFFPLPIVSMYQDNYAYGNGVSPGPTTNINQAPVGYFQIQGNNVGSTNPLGFVWQTGIIGGLYPPFINTNYNPVLNNQTNCTVSTGAPTSPNVFTITTIAPDSRTYVLTLSANPLTATTIQQTLGTAVATNGLEITISYYRPTN